MRSMDNDSGNTAQIIARQNPLHSPNNIACPEVKEVLLGESLVAHSWWYNLARQLIGLKSLWGIFLSEGFNGVL